MERIQPLLPDKLTDYCPKNLHFSHGAINWFQPSSLNALLELKTKYPEARLVVGNTEVRFCDMLLYNIGVTHFASPCLFLFFSTFLVIGRN